MRIGVLTPCDLRSRATLRPSRVGSITSSTIASYSPSRATVLPASPSISTSTTCPPSTSPRRTTSARRTSSSTMSTFMTSPSYLPLVRVPEIRDRRRRLEVAQIGVHGVDRRLPVYRVERHLVVDALLDLPIVRDPLRSRVVLASLRFPAADVRISIERVVHSVWGQ